MRSVCAPLVQCKGRATIRLLELIGDPARRDGANAVLVGRTAAPAIASLSQHEAVIDALGMLDVPILADVECGHLAPYMPLVNGALARVEHSASVSRVTQTLA